MAFQVELTAKAKANLRSILGWLRSQEAGETGHALVQGDACRDGVSFRTSHPLPVSPRERFAAVRNAAVTLRQQALSFPDLFIIEGDTAFILHVRRGSRKDILRH